MQLHKGKYQESVHCVIWKCNEKGGRYSRTAAVIDLRSCHRYSELAEAYRNMQDKYQQDIKFTMLCVEASEEVLLKRFHTLRRSHPVAARKFEGDLVKAINFEHDELQVLRATADYPLDSSLITAAQLKEQVKTHFLQRVTDAMPIQVMSFGFKYGAPLETDLVFDMRCLPNPYYVDDLREHTGVEKCVQDYVMDGGQHRSVTFAELVSEELRKADMHVITHHRDYKKSKKK